MITYNVLSTIIPPDQALANKSLCVALQQITGIPTMTLPKLAVAVAGVETTKGLTTITGGTVNLSNSSISSTTLTVGNVDGNLVVGMTLTGTDVLANTVITALTSNTSGNSSTWTVNNSQTVGPISMTASIGAQTQPVPQDALDYYTSTYANGSGPNNTILLTDLLGTVVGAVYTDALNNTVAQLNTIDTASLADIYNFMANVVNGDYGNPFTGNIIVPSGPYAGTYANAEAIFSTTLIPAAVSEIGNVVTANPNVVTQLNTNFDNMADQLIREQTLQTSASIDFNTMLANSVTSVNALIFTLPSYGRNTEVGGAADLLQQLADSTTQGGQALLGVLREGRTQPELGVSGVSASANALESNPANVPPQISTADSHYTKNQALSALSNQLTPPPKPC